MKKKIKKYLNNENNKNNENNENINICLFIYLFFFLNK